MQINVHVPRSLIREGHKFGGVGPDHNDDPFSAAASVAIGAPAYVGPTSITIYYGDASQTIPMPRSARKAVQKYDTATLDTGVRFRITIPDKD